MYSIHEDKIRILNNENKYIKNKKNKRLLIINMNKNEESNAEK